MLRFESATPGRTRCISSMNESQHESREPAPRPAPRRSVSNDEAPSILQRLSAIWSYRELLGNLTRKELKVKYKNSVLGFLWSLLNPLLYLIVFSVVFQEILRTDIPTYAIFLLSGLLVWNLFSTGLSAATASIVMNASLVQKVWFPREVLPLSSIGAALVHFFLQTIVLATSMVVLRHAPSPTAMLLIIPAVICVLLILSGLGVLLSALNVKLRDIQHLLELVLLAWFWFTPIVYEYLPIEERLGSWSWLAFINPVLPIVMVFQKALYNPEPGVALPDEDLLWYFRNLGFSAAAGIVLIIVGFTMFGRMEADLAEEI